MRRVTNEYGKTYFRRAFWIYWTTFEKLFNIIKADLLRLVQKWDQHKKCGCPNGRIPLATRLGAALRFWASGDPYDIFNSLRVSHSLCFESIDLCCDAINQCEQIKIKFPTCHETQEIFAAAFAKKSEVDFKCCLGCIDGRLVWTHQPTLKDCEAVGISQSKFQCFRKSKYGLNFQAICDVELCVLDIYIRFGGASSDLLAFETSNIKDLLDKGLLKSGLCIFSWQCVCKSFVHGHSIPRSKGGQREGCIQLLFFPIKDQDRMHIWSSCPAMGFLEKDCTIQIQTIKDNGYSAVPVHVV